MKWTLSCVAALLLIGHYQVGGHSLHVHPTKQYNYRYRGSLANSLDTTERGLRYEIELTVHPSDESPDRYRVEIRSAKMTLGDADPADILDKLSDFKVVNTDAHQVLFKADDKNIWARTLRKGIVSLLHFDYRTNATMYTVNELGVHGTCPTSYVVSRNAHAHEEDEEDHDEEAEGDHHDDHHQRVWLTKQRDLSSCERSTPDTRLNYHQGFEPTSLCPIKAHSTLNKDGWQRPQGSAHYEYQLEKHEDDFIVRYADSHEEWKLDLHRGKGTIGSLVACAKLELESVQNHNPLVPLGDLVAESAEGQLGMISPREVEYVQDDGDLSFRFIETEIAVAGAKSAFTKLVQQIQSSQESKLSQQRVPELTHQLVVFFESMNVNEMRSVLDVDIDGISMDEKLESFLQILGLVASPTSVNLAVELFDKYVAKPSADSTVNPGRATSSVSQMLQALPLNMAWPSKVTIQSVLDFCKAQDWDERRQLKQSCWLSVSAMIHQACVKTTRSRLASCSPDDALAFQKQIGDATGMSLEGALSATLDKQILAIKFTRNLRHPANLRFLFAILAKRDAPNVARTEAALALAYFDPTATAPYKAQLERIMNDRSEDHEVRFYVYIAWTHTGPSRDAMLSFIHDAVSSVSEDDHLPEAHRFEESRQFLLQIRSYLMMMTQERDSGHCLDSWFEQHRWISDRVMNELDAKLKCEDDMADSRFWYRVKPSNDGLEILNVVASNSIIPRRVMSYSENPYRSASVSVNWYSSRNPIAYLATLMGRRRTDASALDSREALQGVIDSTLGAINPDFNNQTRDGEPNFELLVSQDVNHYTLQYYLLDKPESFRRSNLVNEMMRSFVVLRNDHFHWHFGFAENGLPLYFFATTFAATNQGGARSGAGGYQTFVAQTSQTVAGGYSPFETGVFGAGRAQRRSMALSIGLERIPNKRGTFIHLLEPGSTEKDMFSEWFGDIRVQSQTCFLGCIWNYTQEPMDQIGNDIIERNVGHRYLGLGFRVRSTHDTDTHDGMSVMRKVLYAWEPYHDMVHDHNDQCPHAMDITITSPQTVSKFGVQIHFEADKARTARTYGLTVWAGEKPSYTAIIKRKPDAEKPLSVNYELIMQNHAAKRSNMARYTISYPKFEGTQYMAFQALLQKNQKTAARNLFAEDAPTAAIEGTLMYEVGVESEPGVIGSWDNVMGRFSGLISREASDEDLIMFKMRNIPSRSFRYQMDTVHKYHRYNTIHLDIDTEENVPGPAFKLMKYIGDRLLNRYRSKLEMNGSATTSSPRKHQLDLSTHYENDCPHTDIVLTESWGQLAYRNTNARLTPRSMPHFYPIAERPQDGWMRKLKTAYCSLDAETWETFDGYRHKLNRTRHLPTCTAPALMAGDCLTKKFVILHHPGSINIIWKQSYNVTVSASSAKGFDTVLVNGQTPELEIGVEKRLPGGLKILKSNVHIHVKLPGELSVYTYGPSLAIRADRRFRGRLCGLCGNFDGEWNNDLVCPWNNKLKPEEFYAHWVTEKNACSQSV